MSQENVEVVRRVMAATKEAFATDDFAAAFPAGAFAVDFEWVVPTPFEGKAVWSGVDECIEFLRVWAEQFDNYSFEVLRVIDAGSSTVVVLAHQSATGKGSGAPVETDNGVVYELRDGCIVRASNYFDHGEALKAAGLSE
jgi:ketosteroid isomerase-like protein